MYRECVTEDLAKHAFGITAEDKIKVLDFHDFREKCSEAGMTYKPEQQKYPGNKDMKNITRLIKRKK